MKQWRFLLFTGVALLVAMSARSQPVEDIINKHIEAVGGKDNLSQIKSLSVEGTMQVMGNDAPYSIITLNGKAEKLSMQINGQEIIQCITDTSGWGINPMMGASSAVRLPEAQFRPARYQIFIPDLLCNYLAEGCKATLLGKEDSSFKIEITTRDSIVSQYYVDTTSYLINKTTGKTFSQGGEVEVTNNFSNYQKTDKGLVMPFTVNTDFGGFSLSRTITKVEVNKDIDPKIFAMPAR